MAKLLLGNPCEDLFLAVAGRFAAKASFLASIWLGILSEPLLGYYLPRAEAESAVGVYLRVAENLP